MNLPEEYKGHHSIRVIRIRDGEYRSQCGMSEADLRNTKLQPGTEVIKIFYGVNINFRGYLTKQVIPRLKGLSPEKAKGRLDMIVDAQCIAEDRGAKI
jgi:hypothetical protein